MDKTLEQMNEEVWKEIADKTLSFGCNVYHFLPKKDSQYNDEKSKEGFGIVRHSRYAGKRLSPGGNIKHCLFDKVTGTTTPGSSAVYLSSYGFGIFYGKNAYEVIGHPPHIGVVMQWISDKYGNNGIEGYAIIKKLLYLWKDTSKPLPSHGEPVGEEWRDVLLFLSRLIGVIKD